MSEPETHPLRLAVGSHRAGTGQGCAMNVISWENGDTVITDLPTCADQFLAKVVQRVNDKICTHRDGSLLCPACSIAVLDLAHRTAGTGDIDITELDRRRVWVRIAATEARSVLHLTGKSKPKVLAAILAAEAWADDPTREHAAAYAAYAASAAAYAAASACAAAASAAYASADAAYADAADASADAAAYAAYAASAAAAYAYADRLERAHRIIDQFEELTGHQPSPIPAEVTAHAIHRMLEVTS